MAKKNKDSLDNLTKTNTDKEKKTSFIFRIFNFFLTYFDGVPTSMKSKELKIFLISFLVGFFGICILSSGYFNWGALIFIIVLIIFMVGSTMVLNYRMKCKKYVIFEGYVIDCKKIGFGKKLSYFVIKLKGLDGKILSFKYKENNKGLEMGLPITLYIDETEEVINGENGPYIDGYLSIQYSIASESEEIMENEEKVSASEFISKK